MEKIKFNGSYARHYAGKVKLEFTIDQLFKIVNDAINGTTIKELSLQYKTSRRVILDIQRLYYSTRGTFKSVSYKIHRLGNKDVEYYSEEELMVGIPNYKWEDLSVEEQQFYLEYGRKEKKNKKLIKNV